MATSVQPRKAQNVSLKTELAELRATKPRTFDAWLEMADPDETKLAIEAITDKTIPINALLPVLRRNGVPISKETLRDIRDRGLSIDAAS